MSPKHGSKTHMDYSTTKLVMRNMKGTLNTCKKVSLSSGIIEPAKLSLSKISKKLRKDMKRKSKWKRFITVWVGKNHILLWDSWLLISREELPLLSWNHSKNHNKNNPKQADLKASTLITPKNSFRSFSLNQNQMDASFSQEV